MSLPPELAAVATLVDLPEHGVTRGEMGTVVTHLSDEAALVEFVDDDGQTYALIELAADQLLTLHNRGR